MTTDVAAATNETIPYTTSTASAVEADTNHHHYQHKQQRQGSNSEAGSSNMSSSYGANSETAKHVFVYLNGDRFYPGRKFVVNRKHVHNFDGFLNEVTRGINPKFGAVRNIYTPTNGHKIDALEQIENDMALVAGGIERFRRMGYRDITVRPRMMHTQSKKSLTRVPPKNRLQVPGRWRSYVKEPCQIYVYGNGDIIAPATKLLLTPRQMKSWDLILQHITEKIGGRTGQAARKLYDLGYHMLHDPSQLENGQYYVAVGTEKLKRLPYGTIPSFTRGNQQISPRRNAPLPPIKTASKAPAKSEMNSYSKIHSHRRKVKQNEPMPVVVDSSVTSGTPHPVKTPRRQPQPPPTDQEEEESVFHARPVKVKRSPPVLTDNQDDQGTIFRGDVKVEVADEVNEDENTKVDVPIDQIPTASVEEEEIATARSEIDNNESLISGAKDENANNISVSQDEVVKNQATGRSEKNSKPTET